MSDEELEEFGLSRRNFFKKMIALGFAVPVVSSFALDGVAAANERDNFYVSPNSTITVLPPNSLFGNSFFTVPFPNHHHHDG